VSGQTMPGKLGMGGKVL